MERREIGHFVLSRVLTRRSDRRESVQNVERRENAVDSCQAAVFDLGIIVKSELWSLSKVAISDT